MESSERSLVRGIGRWDLVGIFINGVVGAGIFALPATLFGLVGTYSLLGWIACAALVGLFGLCFAEVSSRFDKTGGPYLFVLTVFGPKAGFLIGWIGWISRLLAFASLCNLAVNYAAAFYPPLSANVAHLLAVTLVTATLTAITLIGVRISAVINNGFTIVKLAVLIGLAGVGMFHLAPDRFALAPLPPASQFQSAIMLMLFAFVGFESATMNSGEMRDPHRDAPFALAAGLAGISILYIALQAVCIGTIDDLGASNRPLADSAIQLMGPVGGGLVTLGAVITMLGTLMVLMIVGSRVPFAMAEHNQFPSLFRSIHPRFRTPHIAILTHGALALILTANSSVIGALSASTLTRLVTYAATCAALIALRRRESSTAHAPFHAPGGIVAALAAISASLWLMMVSTRAEAIAFAAILVLGAGLGGLYAIRRQA